jgi:hypothetical protein|mmetsp:Transcript_6086/g.11100  ORF Transcript_6086/g.11100 Transcript_6086/m.11100 type:complete len:80 (+) Transcript_6086:160-399(+)
MPAFVAPGGEVDFNKYSIVIAFGDSTITQFAQRNLIWPGGNIGAPLTTDTVHYSREATKGSHFSIHHYSNYKSSPQCSY